MPRKKNPSPAPVGRPTEYKPEYCQMLIRHFEQGLSFESFAGVISVGRTTIHRWRDENPDFKQAYEEGISKCRLFYDKVGSAMMMDQLKVDGKKVKGNVAVWFIQMKNRFGYRDNPEDKQVHTVKFENIPALLNALQGDDDDHSI